MCTHQSSPTLKRLRQFVNPDMFCGVTLHRMERGEGGEGGERGEGGEGG